MNHVAVYSLTKEGNEKASVNFRVKEFACADGSDIVLLDAKLLFILQNCRDHFGKPVKIASGYRTPSYNAKLGNASKTSYHMRGMAADIKIDGVDPKEIYNYLDSCLPNTGGMGLAKTYVHIDSRETKARWKY